MHRKHKRYKTILIGCGAIAGGYDKPGDRNVLTHAHAVSIHKKTVLSGVYDASPKKAMDFARKWNTIPYSSLKGMLDEVMPDIVYVCVPDEVHVDILEMLLRYRPSAVICEKPLSPDIKKARLIVEKYRKNKIPLSVNYIRRYDQKLRDIKSGIDNGRYGSFINASLVYTKGMLHNGSHGIDLLRYLFGEAKRCKSISKRIDYKKEDPTVDGFLILGGNARVHLIAGDENYYSIFELQILFSKARITLDQSGLRLAVENVRNDPVFPGHKDLGDRIKRRTGLNKALLRLIDNVTDNIEKSGELLSSGEDALKTQEVCIKFIGHIKW